MNLSNKNAIVTGASSGIGISFSKKLIDKGATVYGLARRLNKLYEIREELGGRFIPVKMDVTKPNDIQLWVQETFSEETLPHVLINNAGLGIFNFVDKLSIDDWNKMIETNLNGIFYLTRELVPFMKVSGEFHHIVNIASIAGLLGNPQMSGYNASKYGVRGFSEALFKELRYNQIKVTAMFPGSIATRFFNNAGSRETHPNMLQPDDVADTLIHLLETPDNFLVNEITLRPLNPKNPDEK